MNTDFDDGSFWDKVKNFAKTAGKELIQKALWLYYAAQRSETPAWAKATIYGALAYFVLPVDAIPDIVPVVGYSDDLGAIAAALTAVSMYISDEVKEQAEEKMAIWFN